MKSKSKIDVIEDSRGRFIGIATTQGDAINARYIGGSDKYIRVYNRNSKKEIKLAKSSVKSVSYGGTVYR